MSSLDKLDYLTKVDSDDFNPTYRLEDPSKMGELAREIKKNGWAQVMLVTGIDWKDKVEVVYHFNKLGSREVLWIRVYLDRENPEIPSVTPIFPSANWHERETSDLIGVKFLGHPDPRPLLLPPGWRGGPPLRKDYKPSPDDYPWWKASERYYNPYDYTKIVKRLGPDEFLLSVGPMHPVLHGMWRLVFKVRGDTIVEAWPDIGWLHRGIEWLAERRRYDQIGIFADRLCYGSAMSWNLLYHYVVEKLLKVEVPDKARVLRIIAFEMQRIISHLLFVAALAANVGTFHSMFLYPIREREKFLDLMEIMTGNRLLYTYGRIGGVAKDPPEYFYRRLKETLQDLDKHLLEYMDLTLSNESFLLRTERVGILRGQAALDVGATGPVLRAAGIEYDVRKVDPYWGIDEFDFDVVVEKGGDVLARYVVRLKEILESSRIIQQALEKIPDTPIRAKVPNFIMKAPEGEAFGRVEDPRGEAAFYIVSDGKGMPYRFRVKSPTFSNVATLHHMLRGVRYADMSAIIESIDICSGEVDK